MKIRLDDIFDKDDLEVLTTRCDGDVKCPVCNKVWHSPYPKTRPICPKCFKDKTGYDYID